MRKPCLEGQRCVLQPQGSCQVWWAQPGDASPALNRLLSEVERKRCRAFVHDDDRRRYIVGAGLLRLVLGARLGIEPVDVCIDRTCPYCGSGHGRPRLAGPNITPLEISVSHSGERVGVAIACGVRLGLDVERIQQDLDVSGILYDVLTPEEAEALQFDPVGLGKNFLTMWTRKEAALKAAGVGLTIPPRKVMVSQPDELPRLLRWPIPLERIEHVVLHDLRPDSYHVAAMAVLGAHSYVDELDASVLLAEFAAKR